MPHKSGEEPLRVKTDRSGMVYRDRG